MKIVSIPRPADTEAQRLSALAVTAGGHLVGSDIEVTGITASSSQVRPGDVFAALRGQRSHGARFAGQARAAGAVAVLTDPSGLAWLPGELPAIVVDDVRACLGVVAAAVYGQPSRAMTVLGVTGTSGKTTTTFLVRAGLTAAGRAAGLIGTVATMIGEESVATGLTTPEAPDVQALLAVMRERGTDAVAMEVSSHALTMGRADGIDFAVGAFTNLSQDHLDFHAGMEDYFAAKARLFDGRARVPIVVVDDAWGRRLAGAVGPAAITVSTTGRGAAWWANDVRSLPDGSTAFQVHAPHGDFPAGCAVPGAYNVANAVLALAILDAAGVSAEVAVPAVESATVPGRMERIDAGQPYLAIVDYSHKPAAVEGALRALRPLTKGRLIVVLGCGGDRDRAKRPVMGEVAARGADLLIVTDDNPRSEDPAAIRAAMLAGVPADLRHRVWEVGDRAEAIRAGAAAAEPHDTVLVAGKGHETGQEVAGVVHPFDDREMLRRAIEEPTS
jgi:UDP-N-acetylmuramoyl-L-alanyl-D-glutamate--2,6-diaminopimelate ligase